MPPAGAVEAARHQKPRDRPERKVPAVGSLASAGAWDSPPPASPSPSPDGEDRIVAAMLLRNARSKAELAEENGLTAYLDDARLERRVNKRLLKGEVCQARSFNRRTGIEALPATADGGGDSALQREVKALEREWVRSAHQLREGKDVVFEGKAEPRKRQRVGAEGKTLDVAAVEKAEARLAQEDAEMANPLLRPPPVLTKAKKVVPSGLDTRPSPPAGLKRKETHLWPSKGMRVRVVDENGDFKRSHLQKGVVRQRYSSRGAVDVELDEPISGKAGGGKLLRLVPQTLLETVVSRSCRRIEVLRGCHQGAIAELLSRDSRRNVAVIRLGRAQGEEEVELPVDDICEFV